MAGHATIGTAIWELLSTWVPGFAVANPLNIQLSGFAAKLVTRLYHLYAIPRNANRWAVALGYVTNTLFARPLVSIGLAQSSLARFSASEEFMSASPEMHPSDEQMFADELRYQKAAAEGTAIPSHSD